MAEIHIPAQERDPHKSTGRALRRAGMVPGVYYNRNGEIRCLQFETKVLDHLLRKEVGLLHVDVNNESLDCIIREVQRHPVRRDIIHIDLMGIIKGQKIRVHVPFHYLGTAAGIKEGGALEIVLRDVEVECEPTNLPTHFDVDVSHLKMNDGIRLSDLRFESVTLLGDMQMTIVHVVPPRQVAEAETPSAAAAAPEPEVIRERKAESEDEEEKKK
ncbi:50S ribosomal protein L25 [candidate division KSB1 bacterium]|nr:MAG: 50S ribosomal protein L25 [candidate division KSB1 bacterium]